MTKEAIVNAGQFKGPSKLSSAIRELAADLNARGPLQEKCKYSIATYEKTSLQSECVQKWQTARGTQLGQVCGQYSQTLF